MLVCPLCQELESHQRPDAPQFYTCNNCGSVYRDPVYYVSEEKEKQRYLIHNNDVEDTGYQSFVSPLVQAVIKDFPVDALGLDYGAGTGPVVAKLLHDHGYHLTLWDPFFHNDKSVLRVLYDFIVCCEVIEHFHHPKKEFLAMRKLLKPGGKLFCMSELLPKKKAFKDWYYKNDPTHVIFYSKTNLQWIQKHLGYSKVSVNERVIIFETNKTIIAS